MTAVTSAEIARIIPCILWCGAQSVRCLGPWCSPENPSNVAPGSSTVAGNRDASIRRQYLSFGFENRKWLGISDLAWETGPDSTITEHNYSKLSLRTPNCLLRTCQETDLGEWSRRELEVTRAWDAFFKKISMKRLLRKVEVVKISLAGGHTRV